MKQYEVTLAGETVGQVQLWQEGLYVHICCQCEQIGETMYHLHYSCQDNEGDLGLLVPQGIGWGLEKHLPAKQLGQGSIRFFLRPRHAPMAGRFVPLRPQEPFAYLSQLQQAFLKMQNGEVGVVLPEKKYSEKSKNKA